MRELLSVGTPSEAHRRHPVVFRMPVLFMLVLMFVVPKLLGYSQLVQMTPVQKWIYIVVSDIVPGILVFLWVRRNCSRRDSSRTDSLYPGMDPLLTIRFCACLMVLFGHFFFVIFAPPVQLTSSGIIYRLAMSSPWAGVWIFFTLSGYLMGKGFFSGRYITDQNGIAKFYFNRAIRIYPIYIFALGAQWVFLSPEIFRPENLWGLFQSAMLDDNRWIAVGALWSVTTEFQFYLLAPFIAMAIDALAAKRGVGVWSILIVVMLGLSISIGLANIHDWDMNVLVHGVYSPLGPNLYMFVSGMVLAKMIAQKKTHVGHRWAFLGIPFFITVVLVLTLWISYTGYGKPLLALGKYWVYAPPLAVLGTLATIWIFETGEKIERGFTFYVVRSTQYGGTITYCLYAFHSQLMEQVRKIAPATLAPHSELFYLPLVIALVWAVSHFFYKMVEVPLSANRR
ncbi:acyltransferase [Pseudomonas baltica]|uniref:acyltransferase family protein n=1 Tax=Pseudomonas baltica TaxID=2762576 RepID=UPI00289F9403|nr:acyltransferase [Pseudomonas baltica]